MVKVTDCTCCDCDSAQERETIKERALSSVNKVYTTEGATYYPDGTGMVTLPLPSASQISAIAEIDTIKKSVEANTAAIKVNSADISTNAENIAGEQTEIDTLRSAMATIDTNVDTVSAKVNANTSAIATNVGNITALQGRMTTAESGIETINAKDTAQDQTLSTLQALTNNITSHLISNVTVKDGTSNGSIMVELTEEGGAKITSPNYPWGQLNTFQLLQGTQAGYIRGKLILSDGTEVESNDFQILEVVESDVYVTSITLTPYPTTGKLGGTIGYSNGNTQTINAVDVPTAPGVTANINDLLTRMGAAESSITENASDIVELGTRVTAVETKNTTQDSQITALQNQDSTLSGQISSLDTRVTAIEETPGIGAFTNSSRGTILGSTADGRVSANSDGTGSVNGWDSKASVSVTNQLTEEITAVNTIANRAFDAVTLENSVLTLERGNGGTESVTLPSGGGSDEWEELDITNLPYDFTANDELEIYFKVTTSASSSKWSSAPGYPSITQKSTAFQFVRIILQSSITQCWVPIYINNSDDYISFIWLSGVYSITEWNNPTTTTGLMSISANAFNGGGNNGSSLVVSRSSISNYVQSIRRKKSTS